MPLCGISVLASAQSRGDGNAPDDVAPPHDASTGTLAGTADTEGGAATYAVPIVIPPGRAGMQPALSLTYNNRGGDGVMGMGWSISGLSSIHRCPQTPEQDGQTLGVSYTNSDRLCLDGQRLIAVSGGYGQSGTEYRTEVDSHARIIQTGGDLAASSTCFRVEERSGRILHYGAVTNGSPRPTSCASSSAHARVIPAGETAPLSWLVEKVEDRVGNNQLYSYHDYSNGEVLPATVSYTGSSSSAGDRSVNFTYQSRTSVASGVTDIASSYLAGGLTMQIKAMTLITTKIGGSIVRKITPSYIGSAYNGRLLLQSLQECAYDASDSACHAITQFGMNDGTPDYVPTPLDAFSGLTDSDTRQLQVIADLDGDGAREVTADVNAADGDHLFLLQMTADRQVQSAVDLTGTQFAFRPEFYMDVDGDGRTELIERSGGSISFGVWLLDRGVPAASMANGTPTYNFSVLFQNYSSNINITGGVPHGQDKTLFSDDIDGDGRTDIVVVQQSTTCGSDSYGAKDGVFLYRNTTTRLLGSQGQPAATFAGATRLFCLARNTHSSGGQTTYDEQRIEHIADFDGNGLPDFYLTLGGDDLDSSTPAGSFAGIQLTQSATPPTVFINPLQCDTSDNDECDGQKGYVTHWMDVNGDGLEDFVIARPNQGTWRVRLNEGGGTLGTGLPGQLEIDTHSSAGLVTDPAPGTTAGNLFRYANALPTMDADGDGKPDILVPSETAGDLHDGFALKICTIKRVQPLGTEGCPSGARPSPPTAPDTGETCAAYACPEDPAAPAGPHSLHLQANTADPITDLVYPYVWHDQTGEYLPAFAVRDSNANHGGPGTDNSVYHLSMLKFVQTGLATFDVQRLETSLISRLNDFETHPDDLFGDGLQDLVTSAGCPGIDVVNGMQGTSGYWSHKVCSAVDDGMYGPTTLDGQTAASFAINQALIGSINIGIGSTVYCPQGVAAPTLAPIGQVDLRGLPDVLVGYTNGVGDCAVWIYAPLAYPGMQDGIPIYTVPSGDGYDLRHYYFTSSMPVVIDMLQNNGIGGNTGFRSSAYGYSEAIYNHLGRGFQGFHTIIDETGTDTVARRLRTTITYHQKFPLTGKVEKVETAVPAHPMTPIRRDSYTWRCTLSNRNALCPGDGTDPAPPVPGTAYFPYLDSEVTDTYDLAFAEQGTSSRVSRVSIVNASNASTSGWDACGNLKHQVITSNDSGSGGVFVASHTKTTTNTYAPDTTNCEPGTTNYWWINKLTQHVGNTSIVYSANHAPPAGAPPSHSITTTYAWNANRTPQSHTVQPGVPDQELTTTFGYPSPSYGLPTSVSVSGSGVSPSPRTTAFTYTKDGTSGAADGYFVLQTTNPALQSTTTQRQTSDGQVTTLVEPGNLETITSYDPFGRAILKTYLDANGGQLEPPTAISYTRCTNGICPGGYGGNDNNEAAAWRVTSVQSGGQTMADWFDALGRTIKHVERGFDGSFIEALKDYDVDGSLADQSVPFFSGGAQYQTTFDYDRLGRPVMKSAPAAQMDPVHGNVITTYGYTGAETRIKVRAAGVSQTCSNSSNLCMDMRRYYDVLGHLEATVQGLGGNANYARTDYWYDGAGNPVAAKDAEDNVTRASYNAVNQRTQMVDPDAGTWHFNHDALGEVTTQIDARGVSTDYTYDALGRLILRTATTLNPPLPDMAVVDDSWDYDPIGAPGQLGSETRKTGPSVSQLTQAWNETNSYSFATQRLSSQHTKIGTLPTATTSYTYDANGRENTRTYPSGLAVQSTYTSWGDLQSLINVADGRHFWIGNTKDAWGTITSESYYGGAGGTHQTYASTGQVKELKWTRGTSPLDQWDYSYDSFANLTNQSRIVLGDLGSGGTYSESYGYDGMQRLTQAARQICPAGSKFCSAASVNLGYTPSGNIDHKSDYSDVPAGSYGYGTNGCGPHGASRVNPPICNTLPPGSPDSPPPECGGSTITFSCDANGNVTGGSTISGIYDFNNQPWHLARVGAGTSDFGYTPEGKVYQEISPTHTTEFYPRGYEVTHYNGETIERHELGPTVVLRENGVDTVRSILRDRLGSLVTMLDDGANFVTYRAYDAFGRARTGNFTDRPNGTFNFLPWSLHGFTDHNHLDDVWLIHMGGRAYDYNLGRFLSVDPLVQFPSNTQSLNPYSYILNNPLAGKDPSGYASDTCTTGTNIAGQSCENLGVDVTQVSAPSAMKPAGSNGRTTQSTQNVSVDAEVQTASSNTSTIANAAPKKPKPADDKGVMEGYPLPMLIVTPSSSRTIDYAMAYELFLYPDYLRDKAAWAGRYATQRTNSDAAKLANLAIVEPLINALTGLALEKAAVTVGGAAIRMIGEADGVKEGTSAIENVLSVLRNGRGAGVKIVDSGRELESLFSKLSRGGKSMEGTSYPGRMVELPDGTRVGIRSTSRSGGPTIDVHSPNGPTWKVHIGGGS
ncbi:MAG: RHS repeat-associated core domain-containing protein [Rhodanobacteraceae bacterium]